MREMYRKISRIPNYIRRFGIWQGLRLLIAIEKNLPQKSKKIKTHRVPGYLGTVHLRQSVGDYSTFWQCLVQCQYDIDIFPQSRRIYSVYREKLSSGERPLIIDCGGNIGLASVWFARIFPEAIIYTVEPDKDNFELLKLNIAPFENVRPLLGGVWDDKTALCISNPEATATAFRLEEVRSGQTSNTVRAYTIDDICEMAGTRMPLLVKIDIEGGQAKLFQSNTQWVGRTHLIALELDDWQLPWQGTSRHFFSCLSRYPFDYLIDGETIFCFQDFLKA